MGFTLNFGKPIVNIQKYDKKKMDEIRADYIDALRYSVNDWAKLHSAEMPDMIIKKEGD